MGVLGFLANLGFPGGEALIPAIVFNVFVSFDVDFHGICLVCIDP